MFKIPDPHDYEHVFCSFKKVRKDTVFLVLSPACCDDIFVACYDSDYTVLVVRLTCIACFSPIAQSILNQISWNFARTLFESSEYSEIISIKKYSTAQKLDHLACRPNAIFKL